MKTTYISRMLIGVTALLLGTASTFTYSAYAEAPSTKVENHVQISPANQSVSLIPGDTYNGSYEVRNVGTNEFEFSMEVTPYSVTDERYTPDFDTIGTYSQLSQWVVLDRTSGKLAPGENMELNFTINVPDDVPAGGQYATIAANVSSGSTGTIATTGRVAMILYAKIAGDTRIDGSILENNVPGIVFGGNKITATSLVKNDGNVHEDAYYTIKVFPIFSDEEVYTNEDDPYRLTVLPDTQRYNSLAWEETPQLGIYTVEQTIQYSDKTSTTSKIVLVCPVWLIVIFIALILAIIFTVATRARSRKQERRASAAESARDLKDAKKD